MRLSKQNTNPIRDWKVEIVNGCRKRSIHLFSSEGRKAVTSTDNPVGGIMSDEDMSMGCECPVSDSGSSEETADRMVEWLDMMSTQLRRAYLESTRALVATVEAKDPFTERHSSRVSRFSKQIARRMGMSQADVGSVGTAAMLHDIGKISVPDAILNKPDKLTDEEIAVVRRHPQVAIEILGHTSYLKRELPIILHHHEWYDGSGYPDGLAGEDIPLGARILAVADSLDAMLSRRAYKRPMSLWRARKELVDCQGTQFDPDVVAVALDWLDEMGDRVAAESAIGGIPNGSSILRQDNEDGNSQAVGGDKPNLRLV